MSASESITLSSSSVTCKRRACRSGPRSLHLHTCTSPSTRFCCAAFSARRRTWTSAEQTLGRQTTATASATRLGWFCLADTPRARLDLTVPPPIRSTRRPTSRVHGGATAKGPYDPRLENIWQGYCRIACSNPSRTNP